MTGNELKLTDLETRVFVDASNIRACCLRTLGWRMDFRKLLKYLRRKYPRLVETRYYEGIATDDAGKEKTFAELTKIGYQVCALSRKAYVDPAVYREVKCRKCGNIQRVQTLKRSVKLKSNVDVYLATEFLKQAYLAERPIHLIVFSCDGDYAEMIREAIQTNENVYVTVVATPAIKDMTRNTLSLRLKELRGKLPRYYLTSIRDIEDLVKG